MKVDLHNHSYFSDGFLSPCQVVKIAALANCDFFALTDHDTTEGLLEARIQAENEALKFINGVEISAFWQNSAIHIVGLGIDINNDMLQTGLEFNKTVRKDRAKKIALGLLRSGIKDPLEKAQQISVGNMLTRTHFAQMLIQEGYCKDMKSVFSRYLTGRKPGGVKAEWKNFDEVINWIQSAGGLALIAHPFRYKMTHTKIKKMLIDFKMASGDGLEVINAHSTGEEISLADQWSKDFDLLASSGSDFHGWPNQRVQIGNLADLPSTNRAIWSYL